MAEQQKSVRWSKWISLLCICVSLASCGGGRDSGPEGNPDGQYSPAAQLAQICSADNPYIGDAKGAVRGGTLASEKAWVKAHMQERYLWYRDIPFVDPEASSYFQLDKEGRLHVLDSLNAYFLDLRTPRLTASGARVDKFSFMIETRSWEQYANAESLGFGWLLRREAEQLKVAYVYPVNVQGLAFEQGVQRGDRIVNINGKPLETLSEIAIQQALEPQSLVSTEFLLERSGQRLSVMLQAKRVALPQAQFKVVEADKKRWGYLIFNSHVPSAEAFLLQALTAFTQADIDELVLDMRYNSGGYLTVASALARAIAGDERTLGRVFEQTLFSDKRSNLNFPLYFLWHPYPQLDLGRLYVLTSAETCSASESLINGLRGVDVEVVQIGETTCGKPYGFYPQDNCGLTYAAMEFEGVNDKGEGGFSDGMTPQCVVRDDLNFALSDPREPLFATAIAHRKGLACVTPSAKGLLGSVSAVGQDSKPGSLLRPDWQRNKYIHIR